MNYLIKTGVLILLVIICVPPIIFSINAVVLILIICSDLRNWSNIYLNFFFAVFLKNRNIISKIKRSKVTDYAALMNDVLIKFVFSNGKVKHT